MATIEIIASPRGSVAVEPQGESNSRSRELTNLLQRALGQLVNDDPMDTARTDQADDGTRASG